MIRKDLSGRRFHKLTVLSYDRTNKFRTSYWLCRCDCGKEKSVRGDGLVKGRTKSCGCFKNQNLNHKLGSNSPGWKGYQDITGTYWCMLTANAKKRNIQLNITIEYIWNLFILQNKKCALSDLPLCFEPKQSLGAERTASLDRIDSSKGYIEGNVQWVHKDINYMKLDNDQDYFIDLCTKIAKKHGH
jgi:hypothetical protein